MSKRYFWLKLHKDFFKRHDVRIIEEMPNGKDYILFYLKLLVESISHDGHLRFSDTVPYDEKMLATITNTNIDIVRSACKIFANLHLMEFLDDNTIFMTESQKMIGSECDSAQRVRKYRERLRLKDGDVSKKALLGNINETNSNSCSISISSSISSSSSSSSSNSKSSNPFNLFNLFLQLNKKLPNPKELTKERKQKCKSRLRCNGFLENFKQAVTIAQDTPFLCGNNDRGWQADFDWFVANDTNVLKVIEGKYSGKPHGGLTPIQRTIKSAVEKYGGLPD